MKKIVPLLLSLLLLGSKTFSQVSVLQDATGETSLQTTEGNQFIINAQKTSFSLTLEPKEYDATDQWRWRVNSTVSSKNNIKNVLKKGNFLLDGDLSWVSINFLKEKGEVKGDRYIYQIVGGSLSRFKVYNSDLEFGKRIANEQFFSPYLALGYNHESANLAGKFDLLGISIKAGLKDNTDLVNPIDVTTNSNISYNIDSTQQQVISVTQEAYNINTYKKDLKYLRLNIDYGFRGNGNGRFIPMLHLRALADETTKPSYNIGGGYYITKEDAPLEATAGLQLFINDITKNRSNNEIGDRIIFNIVAGFNF